MKTRNTFSGNYNKPFPVALRNLMQSTAKTQKEVSEAIGKTTQSVSQYMNGQSEPGYETLVKIADFFDCSVDYLLGRTDDPSMTPRATDELGLSPYSISQLKQMREYGLNTTVNSIFEWEDILIIIDGIAELSISIDKELHKMQEADKEKVLTDDIIKIVNAKEMLVREFPDHEKFFAIIPNDTIIDLTYFKVVEYLRKMMAQITKYDVYANSKNRFFNNLRNQ